MFGSGKSSLKMSDDGDNGQGGEGAVQYVTLAATAELEDQTYFDMVKKECILEVIYEENKELPPGWLCIEDNKIIERGSGKHM